MSVINRESNFFKGMMDELKKFTFKDLNNSIDNLVRNSPNKIFYYENDKDNENWLRDGLMHDFNERLFEITGVTELAHPKFNDAAPKFNGANVLPSSFYYENRYDNLSKMTDEKFDKITKDSVIKDVMAGSVKLTKEQSEKRIKEHIK